MGAEVVRVENVVKDVRPGLGLRAKRILHGVSFDVCEGEIFGFVGPNGAGKTTTLKVLMGLIRASAGSASILGHPVGSTESREQVGFLPENPYFYDYLSGREILHFYAKLSGVPAEQRERRVNELLETVHLSHAADNRLRTYSKGMLQRTGIAQALVHDPAVLFLDEPMSGLDPIGRKEIRDLILSLRDQGKTIFMNTHILSDVEMVCDRVAIIAGGKIRYTGRIEDFIASDDGGGSVCDVVLANLPADLAAEVEELSGEELRGMSDRMEIRLLEKDVDPLLRLVLGGGGRVVSVTPHRASLEHIFLEAVRQDEAEAAGLAASGGNE